MEEIYCTHLQYKTYHAHSKIHPSATRYMILLIFQEYENVTLCNDLKILYNIAHML
jgi:hypothetical protein